MHLPPEHPRRRDLHNEAHARPSEALVAPCRVSFLALLSPGKIREEQWRHLCELVDRNGGKPPEEDATHLSIDLGAFRLRWERHTEFTRYQFMVSGISPSLFADTALEAVPADWLAKLAGQIMVATHAAFVRESEVTLDPDLIGRKYFDGNALIGAAIADHAGAAFADYRIRADGFSRLLVVDKSLTPRQAGRAVQRLLEIDTYRVMSLLALPVARDLAPFLSSQERELARITDALARSDSTDEGSLLDRLTRMEARIGHREAGNHYRFGAARAYYDLVRRRIGELREVRVRGLQTFDEFIERRLAPAMNTCEAAAARQQSVSARVSRTTQLLSTRVAITSERQNQQLLDTMNRRSSAQLRLQQTVEGLSIAAITYYVVGLVGYAAKGAYAAGYAVNPDIAMAASIPIVVVALAYFISRIRRSLTQGSERP